MKRTIAIDLEDGETILVEVDQPVTEDLMDIGLTDVTIKARETFAASVDKILPVTKVLMQKFNALEPKPNEIEVAFGFNMSIEAGAIIASSNVGANFGIVLRWSKSSE